MLRIDGHRPESVHTRWSARNRPIAEVSDGERFEIRIPDSSTGQLSPRSTRRDLRGLDFDKIDAAVGPIRVLGATGGMQVEVELERLDVGRWGWSSIARHFGFLQDRFDDDLVIWTIDGATAVPRRGFLRPVRLPIRPMLGVIGVAPAKGTHPMIPPGPFGGNMDAPLIRRGTRIRLPVFCPGALVSFGDPHALQGAGEVCGTGIETTATARVRVRLRSDPAPPSPEMVVPRDRIRSGAQFVTTGIDPNLEKAARSAVEQMLHRLAENGWSNEEAYLLSSLLGRLEIAEVVDEPNRLVCFSFPLRYVRAHRAPQRR